MSKLAEKREELRTKTAELNKFVEDRGGIENMKSEDLIEFNKRHDELGPLHDEVAVMQKAVEADKSNRETMSGIPQPGGAGEQPKARSLREIMEATPELKSYDGRGSLRAGFDLSDAEAANLGFKNTIALTDWNNPATRLPGVVRSAQNEVTVADLMLQGSTDNNSLTYIEETTFTNSAAEVAEAAAKPESALDFTERTEPVQVIATWLKATKQLLADVSAAESFIRERLAFMVRRREETQLLVGDGTSPNISGITDRSGIQTQAKGADSVPTAIYKAITLIRANAFAEPTAIVMHPLDWQDVVTLQTADGAFMMGMMDREINRLWGLPVRVTAAMTQNTGLVGAFQPYAQIFRRQGITVEIATEHASDFTANLVTILAEERLALAVYRPAAFATVTGI